MNLWERLLMFSLLFGIAADTSHTETAIGTIVASLENLVSFLLAMLAAFAAWRGMKGE